MRDLGQLLSAIGVSQSSMVRVWRTNQRGAGPILKAAVEAMAAQPRFFAGKEDGTGQPIPIEEVEMKVLIEAGAVS